MDDLQEENGFDEVDNYDLEAEVDSDDAESYEEDEDVPNASHITFDITLPSSHTYLWDGSECQEISGRTVHEEGAEVFLPMLSLPGVVLMPGQVLPLHLYRDQDVAMIKHCIDKDRTFGHVTKIIENNEGRSVTVGKVGTTAEILAVKEIRMSLMVKTIGRQRFKVLETRNDIAGVLIARVRFLPEKKMINLLSEVCPTSYKKHLKSQWSPAQDLSKVAAKKKKTFSPSVMTIWPPWVYDHYNCDLLMEKIRYELLNWNNSFDLDKVPCDACTFSYWVAGALPLDDVMRLEILGIQCAEQRLRCELSLMKKCTVMCCKECKEPIAKQKDVFSMSTDGPLGTYVNPGGHVHETLTVHHVTGLHLDRTSSTEYSWFPGYAWRISSCKSCHQHIGWKFTRVKQDANLKPEKFWGLCRSKLVPILDNSLDDSFQPVL